MSSYRSTRSADVPAESTAEGSCRGCGAIVRVETLNTFGARCQPCYEHYRRERQPASHFIADKRTDGLTAWAYSLQQREQSGERLMLAQKAMWRAALSAIRARPVDVFDGLTV